MAPSRSRGLCNAHYSRFRRGASIGVEPDAPGGARCNYNEATNDPRAYIAKRVKVDPVSDCWIWQKGLNQDSYGNAKRGGRRISAHILSYLTYVGPVPAGTELDHRCRIRACCNLNHLEAVTHRVNVLRGEAIAAQNARKTHCVRGHELAGENLRVQKSGNRRCRTCTKARKALVRSASGDTRQTIALIDQGLVSENDLARLRMALDMHGSKRRGARHETVLTDFDFWDNYALPVVAGAAVRQSLGSVASVGGW